jgi:hypothetical protein
LLLVCRATRKSPFAFTGLLEQGADLLVVAVVALDLAVALALGVLLHLDLRARLVALAGVDRALGQKNLEGKEGSVMTLFFIL